MMPSWIALFRGINVGGANILPMRELKTQLENLGLKNVQTYIQSGNVIFETPSKSAVKLAKKIETAVQNSLGFAPAVELLTAAKLEECVRQNPFPEAEKEPKTLHVYFLASLPRELAIDKLNSVKTDTENFSLKKNFFYLHTPDGIGRSKLAAAVEKSLGVRATARNWRTISKLLEMVRDGC